MAELLVEFRDARPADARASPTCSCSHGAPPTASASQRGLASLSIPDRGKFWLGALTARPPRTGAVVATPAGTIDGFAATGPPLVPVDSADPTLGDLYALIATRRLAPRHRHQLHAAALDRIRSCGFTHAGLWVLDTNERALGFYFRHGWIERDVLSSTEGPAGSSCTNADSTTAN